MSLLPQDTLASTVVLPNSAEVWNQWSGVMEMQKKDKGLEEDDVAKLPRSIKQPSKCGIAQTDP
jgi:hypothetical protein